MGDKQKAFLHITLLISYFFFNGILNIKTLEYLGERQITLPFCVLREIYVDGFWQIFLLPESAQMFLWSATRNQCMF